VLARAAIPAGTRVVVTRRRSSEFHCSVTCSADPGGGGVANVGGLRLLGCRCFFVSWLFVV